MRWEAWLHPTKQEEILHCQSQEAVVTYSRAAVYHFQSMVKHYHQSKISPARWRISGMVTLSSNKYKKSIEDREWNMDSMKQQLTHHKSIYVPTCKAWISKITKLVGPPLHIGILDKILASVNAVATSPSSSMRSEVPVGKNGRTSVKDETNNLGRA